MEVMATWADAEARSTATLVELVAAAVLSKTNPPEGTEVTSVEISKLDLEAVARDFRFDTTYDAEGNMRLFLTRVTSHDETLDEA
jgi:hypothetical protein